MSSRRVKLPLNRWRIMKQAKFYRRAARRLEQGVWRTSGLAGYLTKDQQDDIRRRARALREESEALEATALCH